MKRKTSDFAIAAFALAAIAFLVFSLVGSVHAPVASSSPPVAEAGGMAPATSDPASDRRERLRAHARRLLSLDLVDGSAATPDMIRGIVESAVPDAVSAAALPSGARAALVEQLTVRLQSMLGGVDAMLALIDAEIESGQRAWQPADDMNWREANDLLEYEGRAAADPALPRAAFAEVLDVLVARGARWTHVASHPDGAFAGFRVERRAELHGLTVRSDGPMEDPSSGKFWFWGGGHSIDLTRPSRSPSDAFRGASGLLLAECGFVLRTEMGEPATWNSVWYWDAAAGSWSMHASTANGGQTALMLN